MVVVIVSVRGSEVGGVERDYGAVGEAGAFAEGCWGWICQSRLGCKCVGVGIQAAEVECIRVRRRQPASRCWYIARMMAKECIDEPECPPLKVLHALNALDAVVNGQDRSDVLILKKGQDLIRSENESMAAIERLGVVH